jgi:hypothetical protein
MKHHEGFRLDARARHTHQGNTWEPFVKTMWEHHRAAASDQ